MGGRLCRTDVVGNGGDEFGLKGGALGLGDGHARHDLRNV